MPEFTRKAYMDGTVTHHEYYSHLAALAGISFARSNKLERVRAALAVGDDHLNTIPLAEWDGLADASRIAIATACKKIPGEAYSKSTGVCTLKAAAISAAKAAEARDAAGPPAPDEHGSILTRSQARGYGPFVAHGYHDAAFFVTVRYDDECGNGHNTFSITAHVRVRKQEVAGGCLHEEILNHPDIPEIIKAGIKWHLCSSDGPLHYPANALYHAGDRDCWGLRAGEPNPKSVKTHIRFGDNPIRHELRTSFVEFLQANAASMNADGPRFDFEVLAIAHEDRAGETHKFKPKYTFGGYADKWHECPFDTEAAALDFLHALQHCNPAFVPVVTTWGESKPRELDAARRAAIWPDATDAALMQEPDALRAELEARLPQLLTEFRQYVESLGFVY